MRKLYTLLLSLGLVLAQLLAASGSIRPALAQDEAPPPAEDASTGLLAETDAGRKIFIPMAMTAAITPPLGQAPRVNAPYFGGSVNNPETGIFWFGKVTETDNYTDVRVGYTATELYVHVAVFDRLLWYDPSPSSASLTDWDTVTLFLDTGGNTGGAPRRTAFRFTSQLSWWEKRPGFTAAYQGDGSQWKPAAIAYSDDAGWRGNAPNDAALDRGWNMTFHIPFTSLGLGSAPAPATIWGVAMIVNDRDDSAGSVRSEKHWPEQMNPGAPSTWGQLAFGLPTYRSPGAYNQTTTTIRHKLNGAQVTDAMVGGGTDCAEKYNYWTQWGSVVYSGATQINVQNQTDVADWPCYSKVYLTFPLNSIPSGKAIVSARLTLYQIGNTGGGKWGTPPSSLIQIFTVGSDWQESTINWNNAPLATENVSRAWVTPIAEWPGWPGVPITWDISRAAAEAYAAGKPLRLAVYSADADYHTGRYFASSDYDDWNAKGRPTLQVTWGTP